MDKDKLFQNGSEWLRADFHLHTKADKGTFKYNGEENDFVNAYVDKLTEQNIRLGVVTNHNKFDLEEYQAISKKARKEGIFILPGVELSVNDGANGVHTLIVFDPNDWLVNNNDYINQFITTNFVGKHNFENENERSNYSLKETLEQLDKLNKNHFVIMAHVEQNCGLLSEFDGGRIIELGKNPLFRDSVIALQKIRTNDLKNKLNNWLENKVPCFVEGSDPKSIDEIGKGNPCYIKTGDLNFEAIQYSLKEYQNRVSLTEPVTTRNSHIKSIFFEGGKLDGKRIDFSPELNNLIGIRGSGKSAVLEILRYALNIPLGTQIVNKNYKNDLVKYVMESGGKAIVEVVRSQSEVYRIEHIYGQKEDIYKNDVLQSGITIDAIYHNQQPIYFGQEDLSNNDVGFENNLVNKLVGGKLSDIQSRIDAQKMVVIKNINELGALFNLSEMKKETETVKGNAEHKLQMFKEKGISEKLQIQTSFESDISMLCAYKADVDSYLNNLEELIKNNGYLFDRQLLSETNKEIFEETAQQIFKLKQEFDKLKSILDISQRINNEMRNTLSKIEQKKDALKEDFAKIKREIDIPDLNPDDFVKLNRILETSKLKLIEIERSEKNRNDHNTQLMDALVKLDNLWHEKFIMLQREVEKINSSGTKLFIQVEYKAQKDMFINKLQESFRGYNIRKPSFENIANEYADFIHIYKDNFQLLNNILSENHIVEFKKQFFNYWHDLLTFKVEDKITIKFDGKPLKEHSLGQRASALILFLLAQNENDILIIDQPEDDLDNQTIYTDVIREITRLKGDMQFIFATHNANIPVLGDSEMVVACQYIGEKIAIEKGSIDCHNIQEKIIHIMEGGKEAFDRRKSTYQIWEKRA